jgi:hypothetical protein
LLQHHDVNEALPISYKPFEELSFVTDCVAVRQQEQTTTREEPFLKELTPQLLGLDARNDDAQVDYLRQHADAIQRMRSNARCRMVSTVVLV